MKRFNPLGGVLSPEAIQIPKFRSIAMPKFRSIAMPKFRSIAKASSNSVSKVLSPEVMPETELERVEKPLERTRCIIRKSRPIPIPAADAGFVLRVSRPIRILEKDVNFER